jgi:hypothetical protein
MAITAEGQAQVALWRQKAKEGTLTLEEMKQAIIFLRQDRMNAAATSSASKAKKAPVDADSLLSELDNL